jgi:hypothetical protein
LWKLKWLVLRLPSSRGPARLDKFKNSEAAEFQAETNKSFVPLNNVIDVTQSSMTSKHIVEITFNGQASFQFSVDSGKTFIFFYVSINSCNLNMQSMLVKAGTSYQCCVQGGLRQELHASAVSKRV